MVEYERLLHVAQPGDIRVLHIEADRAPAVGARVDIHPLRRRTTEGRPGIGYRSSPTGEWLVLAVVPVPGGSGEVRVRIERL